MAFTSYNVYSDIFGLENIVQTVGIQHSKSILIDTIREIFRQDSYYKYVSDVFGFPKTPSHLGLDPNDGVINEETTRIFIGGTYRYDVKFNPSIIVKNTGCKYDPVSFNQNLLGVDYSAERLVDAYGSETIVYSPRYNTLVGAWDQSFEVRVIAEDEVDREEISDILMVSLQGSRRNELMREGVFIKSINAGGEIEEPYANDYIYMMSINLDIRSEWRIQIPVNDVCERIGLCLTFDVLDEDAPADGLTINEQIILT